MSPATTRRWSGLVLAASAFLTGVAGGPALAQGTPEDPPADQADAVVIDEQPLGDRVIELTIQTPAFTDPTLVRVYLPVGYDDDPERRWPVTYYLAGTNADVARFESYGGEEATRDHPAIVVAPTANAGYWSDWYNFGAFGPPMYETFVIDQLLPLIDARYRTSGRRGVIGESMGGFGVMMLAARHPDLFDAASSLSGAVDTNTPAIQAVVTATPTAQTAGPEPPGSIFGPRATEEVRWRGSNPVDLAENLHAMDLQIRTGDAVPAPEAAADPATGPACALEAGVREASENLHARFDELGIAHAFEIYPNACHTNDVYAGYVRDSLPAFEAAFARPRHVPEAVTHVSIEPRFEVWGWEVQTDPARALEFMRLEDASSRGFTLAGSGTTTVITAPWFGPGQTVLVDGGPQQADDHGRLHLVVDLGPPHTQQAYTPGAPDAVERRTLTFALPGPAVTRHAGADRITTAVAVSGLGIDAAETVVLARADDPADALAGAPLAGHLAAPLLLSGPDALSAATAAELRRLGATTAVLLGGEAALSARVVADLESLGLSVRRVGGPNRYATATAVLAELPPAAGLLVAGGDGFADALSASAFGAATGSPVVLVDADRLPDETAAVLSADADVTVVGGPAAVSDAVLEQIRQTVGGVVRVAGPTRFATSAALADAALDLGITPATTWVATGADFPDALVAGAAAARDRGVLLLIDGSDLGRSPETRDWLVAHDGQISAIRIAGGIAAVSEDVRAGLEALAA
jgi:S-formylglutathione hydrolase FrmB/putative cell wall-binding protein